MSTPVRVAAYVAALVAVLLAALGLGRLVGPLDVEPATAGHADASGAHAEAGTRSGDGHGGEHEGEHAGDHREEHERPGEAPEPPAPGGLSLSAGGHTLVLADDRVPAGPRTVRFTVTGPDGDPLLDYERTHEKLLHLVAVRRDVVGYQHVHPDLSPSGVWSADLELSPGVWRLIADFVPFDGEPLTLGTDLVVTGSDPVAGADPERRTARVDGYTVELVGDLAAGAASAVRLRVSREGVPVADLQPYLGARGHLVALREGDLAYLHVHPEDGDGGTEVPFVVEVPSPGRYRFFFDFRHGGVVRTASFVVSTAPDDQDAQDEDDGEDEDENHDH